MCDWLSVGRGRKSAFAAVNLQPFSRWICDSILKSKLLSNIVDQNSRVQTCVDILKCEHHITRVTWRQYIVRGTWSCKFLMLLVGVFVEYHGLTNRYLQRYKANAYGF